MPNAQVTSKHWFIRITKPHLELMSSLYRSKVELVDGKLQLAQTMDDLTWWMADHSRILVVSHVGEKTEKEHVHCLVELSEPKQKQTVDKRYKRECGVSGPDYSSKVWDGDMGSGAGSYLFHDPTARILVNVGFTDEQIENFRRLNQEVQKVIEVNKQRASGRCVDRLLNAIVDSGRNWTRVEIARRLITDIKEGVMYEPGDYVLRRYIEEIYSKQLQGNDWEKYANMRIAMLVRQDDNEIYFPK